jgi:sulfite reductase (ferredoxin)
VGANNNRSDSMSQTDTLVDHQELDRYEAAARAFLDGDLDADRFMALRLQQGVYGQRQEGLHMVRIKLPGGRLRPAQLAAIATGLERWSRHDVAHISTRQDVQLHHVPTRDTPALLRHLAAHDLTTREACGNTVRNVTTCPLAGVCQREHVDITTHHQVTVERFLRHPLTQHLPRKFKISFSGCEADCAQGMMHDVGVVAAREGERQGFKVLAGGGLGAKPHEAVVVEPFIGEEDLLPSIEAVISLHHRYSDRKRRARSRVKFLVDRFGYEGFLAKYREELARTRAAFINQPYPRGTWREPEEADACGAGAPRRVLAQRQQGLNVVPISVPLGDITAAQLRGLAAALEGEGLEDVRTTQDQNLMVLGVPDSRLAALRAVLAPLRLGEPKAGDDVVACPGTSTCRLGITSSKMIARLLNGRSSDLRIRVSGCHNSCAQPDTADIGLYGEGRRLHGRLVPHYVLQLGGDGLAGGGLAFEGPEVPAARTPQAVARIEESFLATRTGGEAFFAWARRQGAAYFEELLADLCRVEESELALVSRDFGDVDAFKVLQLGGGECAGMKQEQVAANFSEAAYERDCRNAFAAERRWHEAAECLEAIAGLVGRSLLFAAGARDLAPPLAELAPALHQRLPQAIALSGGLETILEEIAEFHAAPDEGPYQLLAARLDAWTQSAAAACQQLDPGLDLSGSVPGLARPQELRVRFAHASA